MQNGRQQQQSGNVTQSSTTPSSFPSSAAYTRLHARIVSRTAVVGVIGLGYVGLPLAHQLHSVGISVVGYDTDESKVEKLQHGESYIHHIPPAVAVKLSQSARFTPTTDQTHLSSCDVVVMCLPTPVGPHNEPDMSYVLTMTAQLSVLLKTAKDRRKGEDQQYENKRSVDVHNDDDDDNNDGATLIILESTTYPGATDTDITRVMTSSGLSLGNDFFLAFSPEREDPGNVEFATRDIPKLVGGVDEPSSHLAAALYRVGGFSNPVIVSSARIAECAKLLENSYRAVNIAFVNEMKRVFASMGVNVWEVLDAASTKPFGFHRFDPGPGIGGHCIPVDPFYLTWKAKETGAPCSFIELAATVNANMPNVVTQTVQTALNQQRILINGCTIIILGIAYKPNVDDIREAPALVIWEQLLDMGANIIYHDPFVPVVCQTRKHMRLSQEKSVDLNHIMWKCQTIVGGNGENKDIEEDKKEKTEVDAVLLVTHHDYFEGYGFLEGFKGPVIDTRNRIPRNMGLNIVRA